MTFEIGLEIMSGRPRWFDQLFELLRSRKEMRPTIWVGFFATFFAKNYDQKGPPGHQKMTSQNCPQNSNRSPRGKVRAEIFWVFFVWRNHTLDNRETKGQPRRTKTFWVFLGKGGNDFLSIWSKMSKIQIVHIVKIGALRLPPVKPSWLDF